MTIKQQGGIFGRNPTFNDVDIDTSLNLGDGVKLNFGVGDDLVIQHQGSYSIIEDKGTGNLLVKATNLQLKSYETNEMYIEMIQNGAVDLYHNGVKQAYTSSVGLAFPSGKGIDFSATSGTGTSELFDDYEEGVHSTSITCTTSGTIGLVSSNNQLAYTKIGNVVHVSGYLYVNAVSSPTGAFNISLPFTAADLADNGGTSPASIWLTNINSGSNVADFVAVVDEGNDTLNVKIGDGVVATADSAQQIKAGTQIKISLTYKAA